VHKRLGQLRKYLDEERTRRQAEALTGSAREYLALGKLAEALAAAEEALGIYPQHAVAREIRDRTSAVLAATEHRVAAPPRKEASGASPPPVQEDVPTAAPPEPLEAASTKTGSGPDVAPPQTPQETALPSESGVALPRPPLEAPEVAPVESHAAATKAAPPAEPTASRGEPESQVAMAAPVPLTPLPEGTPSSPEAARLLEAGRRNLRERALDKALPLLEEAAALDPAHAGVRRLLTQTRAESRKAEIESLTSVALDAFVQNNYGKAKKAVERTLALDPANRKARELQKILGAIG